MRYADLRQVRSPAPLDRFLQIEEVIYKVVTASLPLPNAYLYRSCPYHGPIPLHLFSNPSYRPVAKVLSRQSQPI